MASFFSGLSGVAFDLDETLYDRDAALRLLLRDWFPASGGAELEEMVRRDGTGYAPRAEFFAWLAETHPAPGRTGGGLWEEFRRGLPLFIQADPTASPLLERLRAAGMTLAVLTNGDGAYQTAKLEATRLTGFFKPEHLLISGALGVEKPDPRAFAALTNALSLPPERVLYVGDHRVNDMQGARRAGLRTCWLRRRQTDADREEADLVIDSLSELMPHFLPTA